ncbi:MAG: hypothetical protein ABI703_01505 [Gemmatimonadales bacterium]
MRTPILSLAVILGAASAGWAQETCLEQMRFPAVGRWAQYQALYNKTDPHTIRYAVVGAEKRAGKDLMWLELRMSGGKKDANVIYQMLVPGSVAEIGKVEEIIMKPGEKPAMKMDGMMLNMIRGQMEKQSFLNDACKDVTLVGAERLTLPAGKFQTQHFRSAKYGSDTWLTANVPFALVKSVGKNYEMTLVSYGRGAKSSITEVPQSMGGKRPK